MTEQDLAALLAEHGIDEIDLPAILMREDRRRWNADTEAAYNSIWKAFDGNHDSPDAYEYAHQIVREIRDVDRLKQLVLMFAQAAVDSAAQGAPR